MKLITYSRENHMGNYVICRDLFTDSCWLEKLNPGLYAPPNDLLGEAIVEPIKNRLAEGI